MKDRYYTAALNLANRMRKRRGLDPLDELPKGKRGDTLLCPLGIAMGGHVSGRFSLTAFAPTRDGLLWADRDRPRNPTPIDRSKTAARFVSRFDRGKYPELIADDS